MLSLHIYRICLTNQNNQLEDPSLLHEASLLDGKWVQARQGHSFDIDGEFSPCQSMHPLTSSS